MCIFIRSCIIFCLQVYPYPDGVLVIPGWCHHFLLLPWTRDPSPKYPLCYKAKEQSESHVCHIYLRSMWRLLNIDFNVIDCVEQRLVTQSVYSENSCTQFIICDVTDSRKRWFFFHQQQQEQELFPLGHSCAVCGKVKCKRHRYVHRISEQRNS